MFMLDFQLALLLLKLYKLYIMDYKEYDIEDMHWRNQKYFDREYYGPK